MKLLIDGMGGDNAPFDIVKGAVKAAKEIKDKILIIGREDEILDCLNKENWTGENIEVINATEVINNDESPAMAVRKKKDSSISKGMKLLKEGAADCFISGGSTGALLSAGLFTLGRIKGVKRPAIASFFPRLDNDFPLLLIDCGANVESKPEYIQQNGIMGSIFIEKVLGIKNPSVALLNVGAEDEKGDDLHKEAFQLLSKSNINFKGNIEGRDVIFGSIDVVATDGFSGNIFLKTSEGTALALLKAIKDTLTETKTSKLGALMVYKKLKGLKKDFDYKEAGGAPILGLKGPVLKIHGSSDDFAIYNALLKAADYVKADVSHEIEKAIENFSGKEAVDGE